MLIFRSIYKEKSTIRLFEKHPDQLVTLETVKFNHYRHCKTEMGDPLESNEGYLPSGGLCGHLT